MTSHLKVSAIAVTYPLPASALSTLRHRFPHVHFHPHPESLPQAILPDIEILYTTNLGITPEMGIQSFADVPRLRHIQLVSAGADKAVKQDIMREIHGLREGGKEITLGSASGIHVISIPPWVVGQAVALWQQFPKMLSIQKGEKRWSYGGEIDHSGKEAYYARSLRGRTAGMLADLSYGYGALGRETARLLKAMGMRIIACNTSGKAMKQDGYIIPGSGDPDGSIPDQYYSAKDPASLLAFLSECDMLVASLPNTKATTYLLDAEKLGRMKDEGIFLNVGRGSLIRSEELLKALDSPKIFGAAIDVTDPEPLPANHPLWSHPKCVITPHLSGDAEGQYDIATDILLENVKRMETGEQLVNLVDLEKGY